MITADMLEHLTTMGTRQLERLAAVSGYKDNRYSTAEFLGITNGGQFCYKVTFHDEEGMDEDAEGKVFLTYDPAAGKVTADF